MSRWHPDVPTGMNTANIARPVRTSPPSHAPLVGPTGMPGVDAVGDIVNATAAPFMSAPPPEQGAAGWVAQGLGGALGVIGAPIAMIDTAFACVTGPIADLFPSLPALTLGAMHVAPPHAHMHPPSLIPPAPPVPLPSLGVTLGSGAISVLIGGVPAARAGDIGLAVTCGSLAPPFEIYTGSSNVFIGGARAARTLDLTKHCNPTSMGPFAIAMAGAGVVAGAAGAIATGNAYAAAQATADAAVLAVKLLCGKDPGVPPGMGALVGPPVGNVLIGGFPCPPIGEMALGGLMRALGKAVAAVKKIRSSRRANGVVCNGSEPIYLPTGENFNSFVDFVSGGLFEWRRHYTSARAQQDSPVGHGFRHFLQRSLAVRLHQAVFTDWDGERVWFPRFTHGSDRVLAEGYQLQRVAPGRYRITHRDRPSMEFAGDPYGGELPLVELGGDDVRLELRYDPLGRLAVATEQQLVTRARRRFELLRDADGHIVEIVERPTSGAPIVRVAHGYDPAGDLVKSRDAEGGASSFAYDPAHRLTALTDARGYSYTFAYDREGRCVHATGQDGLWEARIEYEPARGITRFTEGDGATFEYHWEPDGFVTKVVNPYGGVLARERDPDGRTLRESDASGRTLQWLYDDAGAHTGRIDAFGCVYPPQTQMAVLDNPLARVLPGSAHGRVFAGLFELGDAAVLGAASSTIDTLPASLAAIARRCFRVRQPGAAVVTPRCERDALGRVVRSVDAYGREQHWRYDATGNVIAMRDRDGHTLERRTTSWNLLGERRNALGHAMRYRYSKVEKIVAVTDPLGNASQYDYDLVERMVAVHRNGRVRERYVYGLGDDPLEKLDGDGELLFRNEMHASGFVGLRELASGGFQRFDYDWFGRITEASTSTHDVRLDYRGGDRPVVDLRDGLGVVHEGHGTTHRRTRVLARHELLTERVGADETRLVDACGRRSSLRYDTDGMVCRRCSNGTTEWLQYDGDGRLAARLSHRSGDDTQLRWWTVRYHHSAEGDLLAIEDSARGTTRFELDAAHRLVAALAPDGRRDAYELDAAGNVLAKPGLSRMEVGPGNRLAASASEVFGYDRRDHLAHRRGRDGTSIRYRYDSFDMLIAIERSDERGVAAPTWTASYDGLGRRIASGTPDARRELHWDGDRLAAERSPDGTLRVYQYAGDEALVPIGFTDHAGLAPGRSYQLFCDPVGMPLHIEDERGEIVWWAEHVDPYGAVTVRDGATLEYNLRWPGHYFDPETGLHYNRHRYYDPTLARYLQSDPLGYEGGDNLYAYCANPLVDVDVLGLHPDKVAQSNKKRGAHDNDGVEGLLSEPPRKTGRKPPRRLPGEVVGDDGLTASQRQHYDDRIAAAKGWEAQDQVRYERHCYVSGKEAYGPTRWRKSTNQLRINTAKGRARESAALKSLNVENNNGAKYDEFGPDGFKTRPDGLTDSAAIDVKSMPDELDSNGQEQVLHNSDQLRQQAQRDTLDGREPVVVITNENSDVVRPSGPLADQSNVMHRDSKTGKWSVWDPDQGWMPISQDDARKMVGSK